MGLMQTPEEMRWSVEMEIEAQHYFHAASRRSAGSRTRRS
jgi:hypothetical protein